MATPDFEFQVRVPASSSNFGSGFDAFSAALNLYLKLGVNRVSRPGLSWRTVRCPLPEHNILEAAYVKAAAAWGAPTGGLELTMDNPIPLARGLGSSGAAVIAGIKTAERLSGRQATTEQVLDLGLPLEGHPDNLAASLLGGWVLSWTEEETARALRLESKAAFSFVVAVPENRVSTAQARAILPGSYSLEDAVFNLQRSALFVHALSSGDRSLFAEATRDRLHQRYRARLVAGASEILARKNLPGELASDLAAATISGSGSSLLALATAQAPAIADWMQRTLNAAGTAAETMVLALDTEGAVVEPQRRKDAKI